MKIRFKHPYKAGGNPIAIRFGEDIQAPPVNVVAHLSVNKSSTLRLRGRYDANIVKVTSRDFTTVFKPAVVSRQERSLLWLAPASAGHLNHLVFNASTDYRLSTGILYQYNLLENFDIKLSYQSGTSSFNSSLMPWFSKDLSSISGQLIYNDQRPLDKSLLSPWGNLVQSTSVIDIAWHGGQDLNFDYRFNNQSASNVSIDRELVWQDTKQPPPGKSDLPIKPPEPPPKPPNACPLSLVFVCPYLSFNSPIPIIFGLDCGQSQSGYILPPQDVYIMINDAIIYRSDNQAVIDVVSLDIKADIKSWGWSLSFNAPLNMLDLLKDKPILTVEINGHQWQFIVQKITQSRKFVANTLAVEGMSLSALLTAPQMATYTGSVDNAMTARQVIDAQLYSHQHDTGFTADFRLDDWLIPAGVFSYANSDALSIINRVASSVKATVLSHMSHRQLIIKPVYNQLPWELNHYRAEYPVDAILTIQKQLADKPMYNGVVVTSGHNKGMLGNVKITGTAGDKQAELYTNELITSEIAARQAGSAILAEKYHRLRDASAVMPLWSHMPLFYPTDTAKIGGFGGYIQSITISARWQNALVVRQNLGLEVVDE